MPTKGKTGLREIAPGVYAMVTSIIGPDGGGPHGGFIVAGDKVIVIDAFITMTAARELLSQIKSVTKKEPSYLIYTHSHGDHIVGARVFCPPAVAIAQENAREEMLKEGRAGIERMMQMRPQLAPYMKGAEVVLPDITFCHQMSLCFGNRQIELIWVGPAHSNGDILVYLPKEKVLFAGDLLFDHVCPPLRGSSAGWIDAISFVEELDVKHYVPGHGFISNKKELGDMKRFLRHLRREVKKCYDQKIPKKKVAEAINLGEFKNWGRLERLPDATAFIYDEFASH
ncbi:MAG: MBL fold metallo-hydrolase [Chloroflexota bacterium]